MLNDVFNQVNYSGMTVQCPYCGLIHTLKGSKLQNIFTENGYTMFVCNCGWSIVLDALSMGNLPDFDILKGDR
jgi:hypothetical protein